MERKFGKNRVVEGARKKIGRFSLDALVRAKSFGRTAGDIFAVDITHAMSSPLETSTASLLVTDATPDEVQEVESTKVVDATPTQLVDLELDETRDEALVVEVDDRRTRSDRAIQDAAAGIASGRDWSAPYRERPSKRERISKRLPDVPQLPRKKSRNVGVPHRDRWDRRAENEPKVRLAQKIGLAVLAGITIPSAVAVLNGASIHDYEHHKGDTHANVDQAAVNESEAILAPTVRQDIRTERQLEIPASDTSNATVWNTIEVQPGDSVWELSEQQLVAAGKTEPIASEVSNLVYYTIARNSLNESGDISVGDTLVFPTNIGS